MSLHYKVKAKIRTPYGESNYFYIKKGVLQGESFSAKLFTIYINDLLDYLQNSGLSPVQIGATIIHALIYRGYYVRRHVEGYFSRGERVR